MQLLLKYISFTGLILTIVPSILVFLNIIEIESHKQLMILGTILWFCTSPLWINKKV